ncbi:hypothetical protein [Cupriavidus pampae]|uniref:Uncharacterized protein n=1 Tax=Cupriavidus pampae TaxID=659251 RepID=A0ABM8XUS5_9BURK|nr:hypothetical protein [Cupriavidus pampae]CAG9184128.1 hypothetical protein LMG32289_05520 [Cupriavidus pampae]
MRAAAEVLSRSGAPDLFALALQVRCSWALTQIYADGRADDGHAQALERALDALTRVAGDAPCPLLLVDVPILAEAYAEGVKGWADWRAEREAERMAEAAEAAEQMRVAVLVARDDWAALQLPRPEMLSGRLLAGHIEQVREHSLKYADGVLWFTNPYGVDGVLAGAPDVPAMRRFLTDMAQQVTYGPTP